MSEDIEDVSFLPGESLNRRSVYEPSIKQRFKQLICSKGRATAIIVIVGLFILIIALIASFARPGGSPCTDTVESHIKGPDSNPNEIVSTTPSYIATNNHTFPWKNITLPKSIRPESYDIELHVDIKQKKFFGQVEISCSVIEDTSSVVFHSKHLNLSKIIISSSRPVTVLNYLEYLENEQVYVKLDRQVTTGENFKLIIGFKGQLKENLSGFYLSKYKDKNNATRYLASTQFEATEARAAFPCFDEPDMKANFTMSIIHEPKYHALFNMPLNSSSQYKDNLVIDKFMTSVKMSTYLVAYVISDFKSISKKTKHGTTVSVYAPEDQIYQAGYALEVAVKSLEYFDDMFGIPYPLPKQDLVAIPDFSAGAMENWGLITFRMVSILYDPKKTSYSSKEWIALTVTHELAHQWFGNLVTMEWWDDLWLNEGFATFVEFLGTNKAEPTWQMPEQFFSVNLQRALARDCLKSSHPIEIPVHSPNQINDIFDEISYYKGASLIRMLKSYLGEQVFNKGITSYLKKYKYGNARTGNLWDVLSKTAGSKINVKGDMETWTKQMGYPVVTVTRNGTKISLSQKRFLVFPNSTIKEEFESPFNYMWHIPFTYVIMGSNGSITKTQKLVWIKDMQGPTITVPKEVKFIKGNYGVTGVYRVNYDPHTWDAIINQLDQDHMVFSQIDRAGLLDDAFALARAGLISVTVPLRMTKYLTKETDYLPWESAIAGLSYIQGRLRYKRVFVIYKKYVLNLMDNNIHKRLKWTDIGPEISQMQKRLRSLLFRQAIDLNDEHCVKKGLELFQNWKLNTSNINIDLRSVIQTTGIQYGTEEDWEYVWDQYEKAKVPTEKIALLRSLTNSQYNSLLSRLLDYGLEGEKIRRQDFSGIISRIGSKNGQLEAWRFVKKNWKDLRKWYGNLAFELTDIITGTTKEFNSDFDYTEVQEFFKSVDAGPGSRAVKTALETIQMNYEWINANKEIVTKWLKDNVQKL